MLEDIFKLRTLYRLKDIYRDATVDIRKESSAEHTWSSLVLADYCLNLEGLKLDKLKLFELLLYHDVVEIYAGDIKLADSEGRKNKQALEKEALKKLKDTTPKVIADKIQNLFTEFEKMETKEAKFANAVDKMDAHIHEMGHKEDWKGWSEEFVRKQKAKYFEDFPKMKEIFDLSIESMKKDGYFNQFFK